MTVLVSFEKFLLAQNRQHILKNVSVSIQSGEKIALVGASGAGKSSLLMEIYQRLGDTAALCPQQLGLVGALSAYHNIYMGRLERHSFLMNMWNLFFPLGQAHREIQTLACDLGLGELLDRTAESLSGGERQRVALARACYRSKAIFLGDEPVSSLDPEQGRRMLASVCDRHETAVVALHNPELALHNFHRVIGLQAGELKFDKATSELTAEFLTEFYRGE